MPRHDLQAQGERDLREKLLAEREVVQAIELVDKEADKLAARRQLLATAMRLTVEMAPDLHRVIDSCRETLGVKGPLELYVYPSATFNAAAVRPERGRLLFMISSSLLEAFTEAELRFVVGHEVGHYLFDHHAIPVAQLLAGGARVTAETALQLFAWQRFAEISADRAGLVCAGGLEQAASALFKLSSGLGGDRVKVRIDQFLAQVKDLQEESVEHPDTDSGTRGDWFATHPFSPLRLKAVELFAGSEFVQRDGKPRAQLEDEVQELMTIMEPSYLRTRSDMAEAMRRLLFAGGVAVATATGEVSEESIKALERLLGPGSIPAELKPDVIKADLPQRLESVRKNVPPLRRIQVLRDLCVIARASGHVSRGEVQVISDIAAKIEVDESIVDCTVGAGCASCGSDG